MTPMCNICGSIGKFDYVSFNSSDDQLAQLRENIVCKSCGSISRDRMLIYMLQKHLKLDIPLANATKNKSIRILETSGARAHPEYLAKLFDYYNIWYDPKIISRGDYDIRKYGDLQNLKFPDNYFDVILSSDVFEHVRDDTKAFLECYRVLRPGGILILQVPFLGLEKRTVKLVETIGDSDIFLTLPQYHASNTLVYRLYGGLDLIPQLWRIGFFVRYVETQLPEFGISWQNILLGIKV